MIAITPEIELAEVRGRNRALLEQLDEANAQLRKPIDMLLFCPNCLTQHVDAPEPGGKWINPPHRSHLCHECGWIWRPADVPTNGVAEIKTKGDEDQSAHPRQVRAGE